jgi:hypothetical protein
MKDLGRKAGKAADQPEPGSKRVGKLDFDVDRETVKPPEFNMDRDNGVARYPGQNSPHVGNGSGMPIGASNTI